jgi:hypothetical protein
MNEIIRSRLNRLQRTSLVLGLLGLCACCLGAAVNGRQFFISYLVGYTFWLGLSLGCFGVAMIHHLTGGRWGFVTRRFLEAGFMTLPLMALLFIPLLFGLPDLYPWARPDAAAVSETLRQKTVYLNVPWFCARTAAFFAIWLWMAFCLRKWSLQQDASADPAATIKLRTLSGPGLVIYPLTATFAFVDWIMSTEPRWYSTIFLVIVLFSQILTAFAFVTLLLAWLREQTPFSEVTTRTHFHDLGNLLLTFVIFWTYVSFSQLLIIYSGNLPREIDWYLFRIAGGWKWVIGMLALFHFFVPFFLLLFRVMKQNVARLAAIAGLIFAGNIVEVYWTIEPAFFRTGAHVHWLDAAAVLGLGGVWLALFSANLKRHPLLPQNDPRIQYAIAQPAHAN